MDSSELARVRLVTERYWELQGLRAALVGVAYIAGALTAQVFPTGWLVLDDAAVLGFLTVIVIVIPGMLWLDRYYATVFGRAIPSREGRRFGGLAFPAISWLALMLSPLVGAPYGGLFFLVWTAFGLWIAARDWPLRAHHLLDAGAGVVAAAVVWQARETSSAFLPLLNGFAVIGVSAIISGYLDHSLVSNTLRRRPRQQAG